MNYTLQDVLGSLIAFGLLSLVFVFPGYVIGHTFDLLDFRRRRHRVRYVLALLFSNAIIPILLFLAYRFGSARAGLALLFAFSLAWAFIELRNPSRDQAPPQLDPSVRRYERIALAVAAGWVIFSILLLSDLQLAGRLYFNTAAYDLTTRISIVDAITRTGVPPINPGYYPGTPNIINQLYYFWYILASVADLLGGRLVLARQAVIAASAWCGLTLMAALAIYLRLRNSGGRLAALRRTLAGWIMLLVTGLDIFPVVVMFLLSRLIHGAAEFDGLLEIWNVPILSWLNSVTWAPLHVAGALACLGGLLVMLVGFRGDKRQRLFSTLFAGLAFASALGLSVWVTLTFTIFWGLWLIILLFSRSQRWKLPYLAAPGLIALLLAWPFIAPLLEPGAGNGRSPLQFVVRPFIIIIQMGLPIPGWATNLLNLFSLPINYLFELGFFLIIVIIWLDRHRRSHWSVNDFELAETVLVISSFLVLSFLRSSVIDSADLWMRGWLPAQFVMVIWAIDLLDKQFQRASSFRPASIKTSFSTPRLGSIMLFMLFAGLSMTALELISDRLWSPAVDLGVIGFPNALSPDRHFGKRTYSARQAYDFVRQNIPAGILIQNNPLVSLDRPGGLYGDHQMAIADRTGYGVPEADIQSLAASIAPIFSKQSDWYGIDQSCAQHGIGVLIFNDLDPVWKYLPSLSRQRPPLYANAYYAIYPCGSYFRLLNR